MNEQEKEVIHWLIQNLMDGTHFFHDKMIDFFKEYHKGYLNYELKEEIEEGYFRFICVLSEIETEYWLTVVHWKKTNPIKTENLIKRVKEVYPLLFTRDGTDLGTVLKKYT